MKRIHVTTLIAGSALCVTLISGTAAQTSPEPPQQAGADGTATSALTNPTQGEGEGEQRSSAMLSPGSPEALLGSSFTYQGQLKKTGVLANGNCDMAFRLYDAVSAGSQVGSAITTTVAVANGLFTVALNFGSSAFQGDARWLDMRVRCPSGSGAYAALTPRQALVAAPYALSLMPYATVHATTSSGTGLLNVTNAGSGRAMYVSNASNDVAPLRSDNTGSAWAVYATSTNGTGVWAESARGIGIRAMHTAVTGTGTNAAVYAYTNSQDAYANAIMGEVNTTSGGGYSAAVRGLHEGTGNGGIGVWGSHAGAGWGVYGTSVSGIGTYGLSTSYFGVLGASTSSQGVRGTSSTGIGVYALSNGVGVGAPALYAYNTHTGAEPNGVAIYARNASADAAIVAQNTSTGDTIRTLNAAGTSVVFAVRNNGRVRTSAVEIYGGGDLAEKFEATGVAEPGTLMVIDENNPGQLKPSCDPYDTKVAGIVSGAGGVNPGMTLHQQGVLEGDTLVAIAGRVYVKAEANSAPIKPGDLLTSSSLPGHVMKAVDRDLAQGAIIGKAMTGLDTGTGLVLVLVNLQ